MGVFEESLAADARAWLASLGEVEQLQRGWVTDPDPQFEAERLRDLVVIRTRKEEQRQELLEIHRGRNLPVPNELRRSVDEILSPIPAAPTDTRRSTQ